MKTQNGIAYFDPARDGKTLFLPKEAECAIFDADCVDRLIAAGFEHIEVEEGHFTLQDGCLLDRDGNLLLAEKSAAMSEDMGIKRICDFSFPCYEKREILRIPEGVEELGLDVFRGKIKKVYLPASLKRIHEGAFRHTLEIEEIEIDERNPYFRMENGCLIDEVHATLLYTCGNTVFIPDGVKRIGRLVFLDHRFRKIVIPSSVEEIGEQNFFYFDRSAGPQDSPYVRATHAKIYVAAGSYAEKFFCERGRGDDIATFPHSWKLI